MSDYTVNNLKRVKDSAVEFGMAPELEARFARETLECERTGLSYQRLAPDARMKFAHRHGQDEEVYVIVSGAGKARLDDDEVDIGQWDALRVAPGTVREFAAGSDGLELLAFGTHHDDDVEMLPSAWSEERQAS